MTRYRKERIYNNAKVFDQKMVRTSQVFLPKQVLDVIENLVDSKLIANTGEFLRNAIMDKVFVMARQFNISIKLIKPDRYDNTPQHKRKSVGEQINPMVLKSE